jgi:hypothetical protein
MLCSRPQRRRGITLLEVLISLGILSVGLASVVALVPAGGDQAKKAIIDDRRGALGANALADVVNRRLLDPGTWIPSQPAAANYRVLFDVPPPGSSALAGLMLVQQAGFGAMPMSDELFRSQDDLSYTLPDDEDLPAIPQFFSGGSKRLSEGNFSWLATLIPLNPGASPASPLHRLTVIAMHRRGESYTLAATLPNGATAPTNYIEVTLPGGAVKEDLARLFPPGCVVLITNDNFATGTSPFLGQWRKVVLAAPDSTSSPGALKAELTLDRSIPVAPTNVHVVEGAVGMVEKIVRLQEISPWSQ